MNQQGSSMLQSKTTLYTLLILGLLSINISFAEDVIYLKSTVPCLVEVFPAPEAPALSEKMGCGEKATVLERRGPIVKIQVGKDKTVWVAGKHTTTDTPAEYEVLRLIEYQKKIEAELASLNEQVNRLSEQSTKLINALVAAEAGRKAEER
jgi:hypothetical protein